MARAAHIANRVSVNPAPPIPSQGGVLALTGYGIRVAVERGHLLVEDGTGMSRRLGRFSRVSSGFNRLVVIGHTGTVTLDALRWLRDVGAAFVHIDAAGDLIAVSAPSGARDTRVRRGQACAALNGTGLTVARELLAAKVGAQAAVAERITGQADRAPRLRRLVPSIETADTVGRARYLESRAAAAYWEGWHDVPTRFISGDGKRVPAHWRTFGTRSSPLSSSPRKAVTPGNALLNYLLAILEAEARLAVIAVGCDLGLGVIHAEQPYRDSFVLDLMEPARPHVDAFVLDLLTSRQFSRADFFESRDGWCMLMPTLTSPLASTAHKWAELLAPVAEHVAGVFARAQQVAAATTVAVGQPAAQDIGARPLRTPLTRRNRVRTPRADRRAHVALSSQPYTFLVAQCKQCGATLTKHTRAYCDICAQGQHRAASTKSVEVTRRRTAAGVVDGRASQAASGKKRAAAAQRTAERRAWEATHEVLPTATVFRREIAPELAAVSINEIMGATGLSRSAAKAIRRGVYVPHARHWEALRKAATTRAASPRGAQDWEVLDPALYETAVAPFIGRLSGDRIREVTGLSASYSRRIRHGHHVPHRRHWLAILAAVESAAPEDQRSTR